MINKKILPALIVLVLLGGYVLAASSDETTGSIDNGGVNQGLEVTLPCLQNVSNGVKTLTNGICVLACNAGYDKSGNSCVLHQTSPGGGGGGYTPPATCTLANLVCTAGKYEVKNGVSCEGGSLGNSCSIATGSNLSGNDNLNGTLYPLGDISGSPYPSEWNNAYLYAYSIGITTMPTIQQADMEGGLIRAHMAKMMVNYAIKVLKRAPNTGALCIFDDVANQSTEMKFYIKLSCQLGLMGVNMTGFDPNGEVTRAQFGTVLSRALWGDQNNTDGEMYYVNHLNALKANNIITNTNPWLKEIRGYVMLMLMRASE